MKPYLKWIILGVVILTVLAAAFWYGGGSPDSQGWSVTPASGAAALQASPAPEAVPPSEAAPVPEASPVPTVSPVSEASPVPAEAPVSEASPVPTEVPMLEAAPVPTEAPAPEGEAEEMHTCQLTVRCDMLLAHPDWLDADKAELVPADGLLLAPTEAVFYPGESVFNVLQRELKKAGIHLEFSATPLYNAYYVEGIGNLYEFDCGEQSGWMYQVNGWFPNYASSRCTLQDGDEVVWVYSCSLGEDVGGGYAGGQQKE